MYDLPQHTDSVIVAHVLKVDVVHLEGERESVDMNGPILTREQIPHVSNHPLYMAILLPVSHTHTHTHLKQHVPGFDASVGGHGPSLHDGTDIDSPVPSLVTLAHDADA